MASQRSDLPNDMPDRIIAEAMRFPQTLRTVVRAVAPQLAEQLAYERMEVVPPTYLLDDWRKRIRDVLVRLPFLDPKGRELLLCLLVEHQSTPDQAMPLRLLLYAVLWWEKEWRDWEAGHPRGEPLRLTPVLPVVLHTGLDGWDTHRSLADLFDAPELLKPLLVSWPMALWDLPTHPADELLQSGEPFWQALAVARAEQEATEEFRRVLSETLQRLEPLGQSENVYWHQLVKQVLYWALYRRPRKEHASLIEAARESQKQVAQQEEVQTVSRVVEQTWEEEIIERERNRANKRVEAAVEAAVEATERTTELRTLRGMLRKQLVASFGSLPQALEERIEAADAERLSNAICQIRTLEKLEDLSL